MQWRYGRLKGTGPEDMSQYMYWLNLDFSIEYLDVTRENRE